MRRRLLWALWTILLLIPALITGCGAPAPNPVSRAATNTVPALPWQRRSLPPGAVSWDISPVNGRNAWACVPRQGGGFTVWQSRDAAATWAQIGSLTPATPEPASSCELAADRDAVNSLVAVISWGSGEAGTLRSTSLISTDGGARWRQLSGEDLTLELASAAGKTYAILNDTSSGGFAGASNLVVSGDGMRTWRSIRPARLDTNDGFFSFSLGPATGELVAASYDNTLWRTSDGGASWSQITTPDQQTVLSAWLPQAGQWMFCGWGAPDAVTCSVDMGATWQPEPALSVSTPCGQCLKGASPTQSCYPNAIAPDGSLVSICVDGVVYRLPPRAKTWSSLGSAPGAPLALVIDNQLWCYNATQKALFVTTLPA